MLGAHRVDGNEVALIGLAGQHRAIESLEPLGIRNADRQLPRNVERQVMATNGNGIGINQVPVIKHRDGCGGATKVNAGDTQIGFVIHQNGKSRCIRRGYQSLDLQVTAMQHQFQIAHRQCFGAHHSHIDTQLVANHALGIANTLLPVDCIADRQGMDDRALRPHRAVVDRTQHAMNIGLLDLLPVQRYRCRKGFRAQSARGDVDDHRLQRHPRGALGHAYHGTNGMLGLLDVGDHPALDSRGWPIAKADHLGLVRPASQSLAFRSRRQAGDDAADLGRADVEHGNQGSLARLQGAKPGRHCIGHHCGVAVGWGKDAEGRLRGGSG